MKESGGSRPSPDTRKEPLLQSGDDLERPPPDVPAVQQQTTATTTTSSSHTRSAGNTASDNSNSHHAPLSEPVSSMSSTYQPPPLSWQSSSPAVVPSNDPPPILTAPTSFDEIIIQQNQNHAFWRTFLSRLVTRRRQITAGGDSLHKTHHNSSSALTTTTPKTNEIDSKDESYQGVEGAMRWIISVLCSSSMAYAISFLFMISGLAYGVLNQAELFATQIDWDLDYRVAFIGNSYLFVNDVPRLMEVMNNFHIVQDSCLHAGVSLGTLLYTGNGMYPRWQTNEAMSYEYNEYYGDYMKSYDYGRCTVAQLFAYDPNITYKNRNGMYYNDGKNPCMMVPYYLDSLNDQLLYSNQTTTNTQMKWDFVVLSDQTKRMAVEDGRNNTINALKHAYGPLLKENGAIPILVDTHAFWSSDSNMTGLNDIPTFQYLISEGVQQYVQALKKVLPSKQKPIVAPVGMAYLVIWEENPDLWKKLFLDDAVHSSVYGSYLFSLVLSTTIFGHLPSAETSYRMEYLFASSRRLVTNDNGVQYPSYEEARYLREVAARVVLKKYVPSSFPNSNK